MATQTGLQPPGVATPEQVFSIHQWSNGDFLEPSFSRPHVLELLEKAGRT